MTTPSSSKPSFQTSFRSGVRPGPASLRPRAILLGLLGLFAMSAQVGCSSPAGPTRMEISAAQYPAAFEAAKEAVREFRFPLERIDYVNGEITTDERYSSGIATPWDADQSTIENEWEDYTNMQGRRVRIRFEPLSEASSSVADAPGTQVTATPIKPVAESGEPVVARVVVTLYRVNRPGWRPQTKAVRRSSFTEDPELTARRMFPQYQVMVTRDEKLAARIIKLMQESLAKSAPRATAQATPEPQAAPAPPAPETSQPQTQPNAQPDAQPDVRPAEAGE